MGHVTITADDGTTIKRDLASVIIMDTMGPKPRELLAMEQAHQLLSALGHDERRRVIHWLEWMFPEIEVKP